MTITTKLLAVAIAIAAAIGLAALTSPSGESYRPLIGVGPSSGWTWTDSYARLGSYGYDQPLFEPDVLRRCAAGRYMYTSNPQLYDFCSRVPEPMLRRIECSPGFCGKPLYMSYSAPAYGCRDIPCVNGPGVCGSVG